MRRVARHTAWVAYLTLALSLLVISPAAAYIDPGSGSLVFQAVVAAAVAIPVAVAAFWQRIVTFFSRRKQ
jgi:hypothetical protein